MDGGYYLSPIAGGAWLKNPEQGDGTQVWAAGCKAEQGPNHSVIITMDQPVSDDNITCQITPRGAPNGNIGSYTVEQTSDTVRTVLFLSRDGEDLIDASFDWLFFRGAQ